MVITHQEVCQVEKKMRPLLKRLNPFLETNIAGFQCHSIQNGLKSNQNRSIDKVQNLGNERRYIYKDPRQDSGQRNILYTRYPRKRFSQIYRGLYGEAMLVLT